jgi:hypothetical protein
LVFKGSFFEAVNSGWMDLGVEGAEHVAGTTPPAMSSRRPSRPPPQLEYEMKVTYPPTFLSLSVGRSVALNFEIFIETKTYLGRVVGGQNPWDPTVNASIPLGNVRSVAAQAAGVAFIPTGTLVNHSVGAARPRGCPRAADRRVRTCRIPYVRSATAGFNVIAIHACRAPAIAAVVKDTKSAKAKAQKANGVRSV